MPEFLAKFTITLPPTLTEGERVALYRRESEAAEPYFANGMFVRCWRVPGTRDHWALWEAPDVNAVHEAYESFPMFVANYGRAEVIALAINPNDPVFKASKAIPADFTLPLTYKRLRRRLDSNGSPGDA